MVFWKHSNAVFSLSPRVLGGFQSFPAPLSVRAEGTRQRWPVSGVCAPHVSPLVRQGTGPAQDRPPAKAAPGSLPHGGVQGLHPVSARHADPPSALPRGPVASRHEPVSLPVNTGRGSASQRGPRPPWEVLSTLSWGIGGQLCPQPEPAPGELSVARRVWKRRPGALQTQPHLPPRNPGTGSGFRRSGSRCRGAARPGLENPTPVATHGAEPARCRAAPGTALWRWGCSTCRGPAAGQPPPPPNLTLPALPPGVAASPCSGHPIRPRPSSSGNSAGSRTACAGGSGGGCPSATPDWGPPGPSRRQNVPHTPRPSSGTSRNGHPGSTAFRALSAKVVSRQRTGQGWTRPEAASWCLSAQPGLLSVPQSLAVVPGGGPAPCPRAPGGHRDRPVGLTASCTVLPGPPVAPPEAPGPGSEGPGWPGVSVL